MKKLCLLLLVSIVYAGGACAAEQQKNSDHPQEAADQPKQKPQPRPRVLVKLTRIIRPDGTIVEEKMIEAPVDLVAAAIGQGGQGGSAQIEEQENSSAGDSQKK